MRSRKLSVFLVVLASLAALSSHVGWWTRSTILDEQGFSKTLVESMNNDQLRSQVSTLIVEDVIEGAEPRLVAARPVVEGAVDTVLSSDAFGSALEVAAKDIHRSVFDESAPTVTVQITRLVSQARDLVRSVNPELADAPGWDTAAEIPLTTEEFVSAARNADSVSKWLTYGSTALMVLFASLAIWVSDKRRRTLADLGAGLLAVAGVAIVLSAIGSIEIERRFAGEYASIAAELFGVFTSSLRTTSLWIGALGLLLIAGTAARNPDHPPPSLLAPIELAKQAIAHHEFKEHPLLRSIGLAIAGVAVIYWRDEVMPLLLIVAGAWVAFVGMYGILDVVGRYETKFEESNKPLLVSPRAVWISTIVILFACIALAFLASRDGFSDLGRDNGGCNGHSELCEKRVDEVAFAGTHNSMAAARENGWYSPYQLGGIRQQLDDGVRALLIDSHYGRPGPGGVTFTDNPNASVEQGISDREVQRAEAVRKQFPQGDSTSQREPYLCHAFCELGSTRLETTLTDVQNFLDVNQREVVILFVEDKVTSADFASVAEKTGLARYAYTPTGNSWPTLGDLVDMNKRLIVFGETQGPPPVWYADGFELVQDTPYDASSIEALSCRTNRGPATASMLLLNHWVAQTPPSRDLARNANSYDVLRRQIEECESQRNLSPNIIAVDFYSEGDLFKVVDELNGV